MKITKQEASILHQKLLEEALLIVVDFSQRNTAALRHWGEYDLGLALRKVKRAKALYKFSQRKERRSAKSS